MQFRTLGKAGPQVSQLGFGAPYVSNLGPGYEESKAAVRRALDLGINFFDTAPGYANSEETLGRILAEFNQPVILSTKLGGRPVPFDPRNPHQLRASVETSLCLLRRDSIDFLLVHEPDRPRQYDWWTDPETVDGPVIEMLDDLKRRGIIRHTGIGGTTSTELAHCIRSNRFDAVLTAFNYSILYREAVREVLPAAHERQMGIILGSVLQQGGLARRYDEIVRAKPLWLSNARRDQLLALYDFLDELQMPIVELGLRFALSAGASTILIGPKTAKQVEDSVAAIDKGPLSADVLSRLDEIAARVPFRPFEEPMVLPFAWPKSYFGPGPANTAEPRQIKP
jgi:aryl-alcohol dehydrogenase-like predicted oxidoreductase